MSCIWSTGLTRTARFSYNYTILDITILMSHSGYNGTCCPPWKSTTPPNEWLSRSFSRETKGWVIRRSTYLKPFSTGRAETCTSPSLSLSLSSRKQVASLRAQRGHIRFSPSCFCSFRHLSSNSSLLFVTDITAHNRVRYFCSRTNRTNREGVE